MDDYKIRKNLGIKDIIMKNKISSPNVFLNVGNTEKNKQYIKLKQKSNSLSKDIELLMDIFGIKNNNSLNKGLKYKKFIERNKILLQRKPTKRYSSLLSVIDNYIKLYNNKSKESKKIINKSKDNNNIKMLNKSKEKNLINKDKTNKTVENLTKIPKINFNILNIKSLGKKEINIDNINKNDIKPKIFNARNKELKNMKNLTETNENVNLKKINNINNNSSIIKFPSIIESKSTKNCINRIDLIRKTDKAEKLIKEKNAIIKDRINYKLAELNLIDWAMKSKLKFARWKFDIPEIEKYFYDMNTFDKAEKQELMKRKTFYDHVEELVEEIQKEEEEKDMKKIKDKHYKEEEKENEDNEEINIVQKAINKYSEASKILQIVKNRRLDEERKRYIIDNILINSDLIRRSINRSTDKLHIHRNKNKKEDIIKTLENKSEE